MYSQTRRISSASRQVNSSPIEAFRKVSRHRTTASVKYRRSSSSLLFSRTGRTISQRPADSAMTLVLTRCLTGAFLIFSLFCHCLTGTKLSAQTRPLAASFRSTSWALSSFGIPVRNLRKLAPRLFNSRYKSSSSPSSSSAASGRPAPQSISSYRWKLKFPSGAIFQK